MWTESKKLRIYLAISFAFRLLYGLRFSYFHPDEHLQGPQEIAHGIFGWASQTPWELTSEYPLRSFVPLLLVYGIPMGFFPTDTDPVYVLYALRGLFAIFTWVLEDMAVHRLAKTRNDKVRSLFFVSTSYVTLTWQSHTFSNSFETILVLWFLVILFEAESLSKIAFQSFFDRQYDGALLGVIVVLGIFNRPTFLAFLLIPSFTLLKLWYRNPAAMITFAISAFLTLSGCIYVDTLLYGNNDGWVITPLNFVRYNMSSSNLSAHGIHSRITHLVVNIPQLLGPGLLLLRPNMFSLPMQTVVSALSVLSMFPHQEARFMLPLVPLLCSQMDVEHFSSARIRKFLFRVWLAFNLILGIYMGLFHQGGVIPAQVRIRDIERPATVIWWKTYTPPLWVTGLQSNQIDYIDLGSSDLEHIVKLIDENSALNTSNKKLTEVDLQGASEGILKETLLHTSQKESQFYLVAPLAKQAVVYDTLKDSHVSADLMWKTIFHSDPMTPSFKLGLGIWQLNQLV